MSEALVPCVLCGHRVGASTVLTHVCNFSDTSSLKAELAEAKAEIERLTEERDRPYVKPGVSGFVYQQPANTDAIGT